MKFFFTLFSITFCLIANAQRCVTPEYSQKNRDFNFVSKRTGTINTAKRTLLKNEIINIPVIVHVLYNNNQQNISDAQVISQINSLNNDFRRKNADTVNTPAAFRSVAADTRIQFCLAKVDPNGKYTTGIIHKYTTQSQFQADDAMKFSAQGGDDAWDGSRYLNIWVCNLFGRTLGYAVLPGSPAEKDGVVIQYNAFGTIGNLTPPFDKGRTTTHEIGHWLGLQHLWGDTDCGDDGIPDTPPQQGSNSGCPSFPHLSSCSNNPNGDMFMDYMDFTNDACMNMFTNGQKEEMRSLFVEGGFRNSFLGSIECDSTNAEGGPLPKEEGKLKITLYPNPASSILNISSNIDSEVVGHVLRLYDASGKLCLTQIIQSQNTILNVSRLTPGMYILKIEGKSGPHIFKMMKIGVTR
ncbi:MAG: M43 family zinc metalloprotease [Ginsengibacter sp.]